MSNLRGCLTISQGVHACSVASVVSDFLVTPGSSVYGISQQEYCSGLPFLPPWDLPDTEIEPAAPG